jgi:hypothetical protein
MKKRESKILAFFEPDRRRDLVELEDTFSDFQNSSKDLEKELEQELQSNEKRLKVYYYPATNHR